MELALEFNGTTDYVQITDQTGIQFEPSNKLSVSFWFWLDSFNNNILPRFWEKGAHYSCIMGDNLNARYRNLALEVAASVDNGNGNGGVSEYWGGTVLNTGRWYHAVQTFDGTGAGKCRMWLNGVEETVTPIFAWSGTLSTTPARDLWIGRRRNDLLRNLQGKMKQLCIWNRVLSPDEVAAIYQSKNPAAGALCVYDLGEGRGTTVLNSVGAHGAGTLTAAKFTANVPFERRGVWQPPQHTSAHLSVGSDPRATGRLTAYDNAVLALNPVGYWPMGGSSIAEGMKDISGKGRDMFVPANVSTPTLQTTGPNGNSCFFYNGTSDYTEIADANDFSCTTTPGNQRLTICAWIRIDVLNYPVSESTNYVHLISKGATSQYEWVVRKYGTPTTGGDIGRDHRISGYAFNPAGGLGVGSFFQDTVSIGEWIFVAHQINTVDVDGSFPTGYTQIYKNGVQRDKDSLSALTIVPTNGTAPVRVGTQDFNSYWKGGICRLAIFQAELTAAQLLELYRIGSR